MKTRLNHGIGNSEIGPIVVIVFSFRTHDQPFLYADAHTVFLPLEFLVPTEDVIMPSLELRIGLVVPMFFNEGVQAMLLEFIIVCEFRLESGKFTVKALHNFIETVEDG